MFDIAKRIVNDSFTYLAQQYAKANWNFYADVLMIGSGAGLPYGSCGGDDIGWTQATAAAGTWYLIADATVVDGPLNLVAHDGNGKLTVTHAGTYLVNWAVSAEISANNTHVEVGVSISGADPAANLGARNHVFTATANQESPLSGSGIFTVGAGATIELAISTPDAGTPNLAVNHFMLAAVMVGG